MANYTIDRSLAASGSVTVTEATVNTDTNVSLVGQNFTGYGDEIATNFLQMLENFAADVAPNANPRVPGSSAIAGQLWYDTANEVLKVYSGTAWVEQSQALQGSVESSTLRWNNTNGRYQPEERVRVSDAGSLLIDNTSAGTNAVTFNHGGTNFTATFAGTTDFTISGLTGDLTVTGGRGLSVENGATALAIRAGGSSDINFTAASANTMNMPAGVKMITAAATTTRAGIQIPEMIGTPAAPADGDVWVTAAGNFYARLNGSTVDLAAAAGGTVTASGGPLNNEVAVFTGGTDIDSDSTFTWDGTTMFATNVTGTNIGGIASANLIDRAIPGTLAATIFSGNITAQANILLGDDDKIIFGTGSDVAVDFDSGTGDFDIAATSAVDLNITGFSGSIISSRPIHATSGGSESVRVIGDAATWITADSYISFYDSDESEHGLQIGTIVADSSAARINARLGNLKLYASNTLAADIGANETTWTQNTVTALVLRNAFLKGANATTTATVGDHNATQYNVGYNETPTEASVGANINTGSFTLGAISIGKMISRTTSTSRSVTLDADTDIPVGGSVLIHNGSSGGTLTIVPAGGQTLNWIDGSGTLPASATRTLAYNSICTVRKVNGTTWQIWGNGLS